MHHIVSGMSPPPPAAVWKPPPNGHAAKYPAGAGAGAAGNGEAAARLSPDSGRGSDRTGSDTSNSYSDKEQHGGGHGGHPKSHHPSHLPAAGLPPPNPNGSGKQFGSHPSSMHHPQQQQYFPAPAYRYGTLQ